LRSVEDAAADLGEFGNEGAGVAAGQGGGVYLGGQQNGGGQVCAASETTLVSPSWEVEELRDMAAHATVVNQILICAF
jgi:hypothetical protein